MEAKERAFTFIANEDYYDIPFFQRAYVWDEDNWEELLDNFFDNSNGHYIGSIILKQGDSKTGDRRRFLVIDGQQRLTTLSVLIRACYDRMLENKNNYEEGVLKNLTSTLEKMVLLSPDAFSVEKDIKIRHSHLDAAAYNKVIRGEITNLDYKSDGDDENQIIKCYKYFRNELKKREEEDVRRLWKLLTTNVDPFIVIINLSADEDEQKIFDTVNTTGVRLSSSDTIKNSLYQRLIELFRNGDKNTAEEKALKFYNETWGKTFEEDEDSKEYWSTLRRSGRLTVDNIETLLYAYAVINGFFNPAENNRVQLPQKYKEKIRDLSDEELSNLIKDLMSYAQVFKNSFINFEKDVLYSFDDYVMRILHICNYLDVSTFYPYILNQIYLGTENQTLSKEDMKNNLADLERYIVLNAICGGSNKNYNNECVQLIRGNRTPNELLKATNAINRFAFEDGLRSLRNNKLPTVILFWVELFDRSSKYSDIKALKYTYSLEHIIPQKWKEHWSVKDVPVYGEDKQPINDEREAKETRSKAVYQIGNMTLLNSKLNSSISNNKFSIKVHGDGKGNRRSMADLADLYLTREVIECDAWDERNVYERTESIQDKILKLWNIQFDDDAIDVDASEEELKKYYTKLAENKDSLLEVATAIERLQVSQETKTGLYWCAIEHFINRGYGWNAPNGIENYYQAGDIAGLRMISENMNTPFAFYIKALLAVINREEADCITYLRNFIAGKKNGDGFTEKELSDLFISIFRDAYYGFYRDLGNELKQCADGVVISLCEVLDDFYKADDKEKILIMERVLSKYPNSSVANILVICYKHIEKDWQGIVNATSRIDTSQWWSIMWPADIEFFTAESFSRLKNSEKAIEHYRKVLELEPSFDYARTSLAWELCNAKRYYEALEEYQKCIDENQNITYAANGYARVLIAMKDTAALKGFLENPPVRLKKSVVERANRLLNE